MATKNIDIVYQRFKYNIQNWGYKRLGFRFFVSFFTQADTLFCLIWYY